MVTREAPITASREERPTVAELAKLLDAAELSFASAVGRLDVPDSVQRLLATALPTLADGGAVVVLPLTRELTPRQAAELLGISRPYLMRLLKGGRIPAHRVGSHHRLRLEDVLAYKRARDAERRRELDLLARESQEAGLAEEGANR
jgi:excisionase family DNA binding protein